MASAGVRRVGLLLLVSICGAAAASQAAPARRDCEESGFCSADKVRSYTGDIRTGER